MMNIARTSQISLLRMDKYLNHFSMIGRSYAVWFLSGLPPNMILEVTVTAQIVTQILQFKAENVNVHVYMTIFERRNDGFEVQSV